MRPGWLALDDADPFVWPPDKDSQTWLGFRSVAAGDQRDLEEIPLREIGNAMVALCRDTGGMSPAELSTEALAVFGGRRRTAGITARLDAARELAQASGLLVPGEGGRLNASTAPGSP